MMETFNVGIDHLNDLANSLQMKASSDIEQMKSKVASQKMTVEKVGNLTYIYKKIICLNLYIIRSTSDIDLCLSSLLENWHWKPQMSLETSRTLLTNRRNYWSFLLNSKKKLVFIFFPD